MLAQIVMDFAKYGPWMKTNKGDTAYRLLADRHYIKQTPGASQFCCPGKNLALRLPEGNECSWCGTE